MRKQENSFRASVLPFILKVPDKNKFFFFLLINHYYITIIIQIRNKFMMTIGIEKKTMKMDFICGDHLINLTINELLSSSLETEKKKKKTFDFWIGHLHRCINFVAQH